MMGSKCGRRNFDTEEEVRSEVATKTNEEGELIQGIMAWHCNTIALQFAIIAFPSKWTVLAARCILHSQKGRATSVIALGIS